MNQQASKDAPARIIVALTGATGAIYGYELLRRLRDLQGIETHLIVSAAGAINVREELNAELGALHELADVVYKRRDIAAAIASGSFLTAGMYVAPCSMKTLAGIATGIADNLITRAADVTLKERRRLLLLTRETPLNLVHLRNMVTVTEMGAIVMPPVPAFYAGPQSIDDIVQHTVSRMLDAFGLDAGNRIRRWSGLGGNALEQASD